MKKKVDVNFIRQKNISLEMLRLGITPDNVELFKNGNGFMTKGKITEKNKRLIQKFSADQHKVMRTLESIVDEYYDGNWSKFRRENNLPADFKEKVKRFIRKAPDIFDPFGVKLWIIDKYDK
jgi:hypothetical protein